MFKKILAVFALGLYLACASATVSINDAGTWRNPYAIFVNDAGTWREIQEIYVNDAGTWRSVYSMALVADISPDTIACVGCGASPTRNATCSATNGSGSYTYFWSIDSNTGPQPVNLTNATSATATFGASMPVGGFAEAIARCTVTDTVTGRTDFELMDVLFER